MPTINARRLAVKLTKLRERNGWTQREVCAALGMGPASITRYERAEGQPKLRDLRTMLAHYGATEEERCLLESLRLRAREKGWWAAEPFVGEISPSYEMYCSLELDALRIEKFSPIVVHGPLQTDAYAMSLKESFAVGSDVRATGSDLRVERWKALESRHPKPDLTVFVDESVLRRTVGSPEVMIEQLHHLAALPEWVTLRVLPMAGPVVSAMCTFTMFFLDAGDAVAVDEGTVAQMYYENHDQIDRFKVRLDRAAHLAYSGDESRDVILDMVKVFERHGSGFPQVK
ncbi:helix-turn-helix transcriptional regulator [Longispora sp. K20-0274]|uniref:helix-turn-helix domain-containing protein n=1 Tax=Longispora sp. K20-0274 TaxID=3088255 RepID=UPI00399AA94D